MQKLKLVFRYLNWYFKAKNRHGIHSPFVYNFLQHCLYKDSKEDIFQDIEKNRKKYKQNTTLIRFADPGAGSRVDFNNTDDVKPQREISVGNIARTSLQPPKYCRLYFRMIRYFGSQNILEMGTSLGITTSYMITASKDACIDTIEGVPEIASIASTLFKQGNSTNINLHTGLFIDILPGLLQKKKYDLIFLDGDHRGEKVLGYFSMLVKHINPACVIIIDDIRWSDSMFAAWQTICKHKEVRISLDLFNTGILFFDPRLYRQDFLIRY